MSVIVHAELGLVVVPDGTTYLTIPGTGIATWGVLALIADAVAQVEYIGLVEPGVAVVPVEFALAVTVGPTLRVEYAQAVSSGALAIPAEFGLSVSASSGVLPVAWTWEGEFDLWVSVQVEHGLQVVATAVAQAAYNEALAPSFAVPVEYVPFSWTIADLSTPTTNQYDASMWAVGAECSLPLAGTPARLAMASRRAVVGWLADGGVPAERYIVATSRYGADYPVAWLYSEEPEVVYVLADGGRHPIEWLTSAECEGQHPAEWLTSAECEAVVGVEWLVTEA